MCLREAQSQSVGAHSGQGVWRNIYGEDVYKLFDDVALSTPEQISFGWQLNKDRWVSPKKRREDILEEVVPWEILERGRVTFLWQRATPVIAGCFACRTLKNDKKWYT